MHTVTSHETFGSDAIIPQILQVSNFKNVVLSSWRRTEIIWGEAILILETYRPWVSRQGFIKVFFFKSSSSKGRNFLGRTNNFKKKTVLQDYYFFDTQPSKCIACQGRAKEPWILGSWRGSRMEEELCHLPRCYYSFPFFWDQLTWKVEKWGELWSSTSIS